MAGGLCDKGVRGPPVRLEREQHWATRFPPTNYANLLSPNFNIDYNARTCTYVHGWKQFVYRVVEVVL